MPRKPLLSVLFLMLFFIPPAHGQDYSTARHAAASAISSRHFNDALNLLSPLLKTHSQDASLWTLRGLALDGVGRTKESLASFDHALVIDKTFLPALEGASQTAYLHGDPRASHYVHQLLALAPTNPVANAMAGALAYQSHDCTSSVTYFERSAGAVSQDQNALGEFADCLLKKGDAGRAVEVLSQASEQHPENVQLRYNLAVAELQNHNPDAAIEALAPLSSDKDSGLLNLLASAYAQANRPDDAFRVLESAIEISPVDPSNYLDLAILCLEHHQEKRSVVAATAGIAKIPQTASLYLIRGVAYAQLADYDKAEDDFVAAARIEPDQPHSTIAMSLLYSDRNQLDKEKALLNNQLKLTPNDAVTNYMLADLLIRSGAAPGQPEFKEAHAALARSLAAKPDSAEAQVLIGKVLEQENDLPAALDHYQIALKAEPENRSALDREFVLLRKLHRNAEAAEVLTRLKSVLNNELKREKAATQVRVNPQTPAD
ncbi:lipopolysaccharide assembly protein LapB [Acidobacterium sp. S8]|uniref:tetratricopeptide repeat protein n=1 Tax=Acidobacterium sp. S8 TaxID=1641854 RepID=UPI00131B117F|nr:tetratricopeptide repeat protein [Acidobacterium sp. S8]